MIRINLIPYRGARRQRRILQHIMVAVGVAGLAALIGLGAHLYGSSALASLKHSLASLQAQNRVMARKVGKIRNMDKLRTDVQQKLALVDQLQRGRFHSLETLLALSRAIPEKVWLLSVRASGGKIELTGLGESNKAVANFMRALDREPEFYGVSLQVIRRRTIGQVPIRNFSLTMRRTIPPGLPLKSARVKPS